MVPASVVNWFYAFRNTLITNHCAPGNNKPIFCLLDETFDEFLKSYPDSNVSSNVTPSYFSLYSLPLTSSHHEVLFDVATGIKN